jgi:putative ABC transport system permease protein
MNSRDVLRLAWQAVWFHRQRSVLTMLGILIGIASVILLTSIGEGARVYILSQFTQFGTTLIGISPGRIETTGLPGALGTTIHPLTLADALDLERIRGVEGVVPVVAGTAPVEQAGKTRNTFVYGVTADAPDIWRIRVRGGRFLPVLDPDQTAPVAVLGPKVKRELFGEQNCLGQHVRIAGERFMVIGLMESKGQFLGFDIDDSAFITVANAMRLFNLPELNEIDLLAASPDAIDPVAEAAAKLLRERHRGQEDVTIVTQKEAQETVNNILGIVSAVVTGIAAISLLVGAIGILTIMWIVVQERVSEIGLVKALGARGSQIIAWYLFEAAVTAFGGGLIGLLGGMGSAALLGAIVRVRSVHAARDGDRGGGWPPGSVAPASGR